MKLTVSLPRLVEYRVHSMCWEHFQRLNGLDLGSDINAHLNDGIVEFKPFRYSMHFADFRDWTSTVFRHHKPEMFLVGHRELFEKPGRNGYTTKMEEAGHFTLDEAKRMTAHGSCGGFARWYIPVKTLEMFNDGVLTPDGVY